jgi:hypothetical protein
MSAEDPFAPGAPEAEIERLKGQPVMVDGERGKLGWVMLTNDRILFTHQKFAAGGTAGALGGLVAAGLQKRSEKKAGGPREVVVLSKVTGAQPVKRRMLADLWELEMADGSTCRLAAKTGKKWDPTIRRLLTDRHGKTVVEEGEGAWRVE